MASAIDTSSTTLEQSSWREETGLASTTLTNNLETTTLSCQDEEPALSSQLKSLPRAMLRKKLSFPLKFERNAFCLDFASAGGSATSDCEKTSLKLFRSDLKRKGKVYEKRSIQPSKKFKKKFSSAEKL